MDMAYRRIRAGCKALASVIQTGDMNYTTKMDHSDVLPTSIVI